MAGIKGKEKLICGSIGVCTVYASVTLSVSLIPSLANPRVTKV